MKKLLLSFLFLAGIFAFAACTEGLLDDGNDSVNNGGVTGVGTQSVHGPITLKLEDVTATTALFSGLLDMQTAMLYTELGIIYSMDAELSQDKGTRLKITSIINNNKFMETISGLSHSSEVYYAPYYRTAAGLFVVGKVNKLRTIKPTISISTDMNMTGSSVTLFVGVSGVLPVDLQFLKIGVICSDDKNNISNGQKYEIEEIAQEGKTSVTIDNMTVGATRYYCSYVEQNGYDVYGDIQELTLPDPYRNVQKDLDKSSAVNLSSAGKANCYIVSCAGLYSFKAVIGNTNTPVGDVASCAILWESFGTYEAPKPMELIDAICYKDKYIVFKTADTFKEGNAVIAAKDASGKILWSWHIWLTDMPKAQVYYNNAGTMMDRNLGANAPEYKGLFYQWGRKDPFVGKSAQSYTAKAGTSVKLPVPVMSDNYHGTIEYAVANPTTFILFNDYSYNYTTNWLYESSSVPQLWKSAKTIYDPCPAGWRVPDGGENGVWAKASGENQKFHIDNENIFTGIFGNDNIYYPYTHNTYQIYNDEYYETNKTKVYISGPDEFGYYWSCTVAENAYKDPYSFEIAANGTYYAGGTKYHMAYPTYLFSYPSFAYAVRCQKE